VVETASYVYDELAWQPTLSPKRRIDPDDFGFSPFSIERNRTTARRPRHRTPETKNRVEGNRMAAEKFGVSCIHRRPVTSVQESPDRCAVRRRSRYTNPLIRPVPVGSSPILRAWWDG
jgi:hypothetical protein